MVYLSPCSSHCWFKPCAWGHGSPLGLVSPAWRSVGPCARDLPSWSMTASSAWVPHSTSKTGALPSFHLNVSCEFVAGCGYNRRSRHLRGTEGEMEAERGRACLCVKHHHQGCPPSPCRAQLPPPPNQGLTVFCPWRHMLSLQWHWEGWKYHYTVKVKQGPKVSSLIQNTT